MSAMKDDLDDHIAKTNMASIKPISNQNVSFMKNLLIMKQ